MIPTETRPYDAAAYLTNEEECALYLQAVIDEADGDVAMIVTALGEIAKARGMALETGGNPSFATVMKTFKTLGLKLRAEPDCRALP